MSSSQWPNILFVSPVADLKGGAEHALLNFLKNPSINPKLVVPAEGELAKEARRLGVPVDIVDYGHVLSVRRPFKPYKILGAFRSAYKAARSIHLSSSRHQADWIHSNGLKTHGIVCLGKFFCSQKIICHIHDIPGNTAEKVVWKLISLISNKVILVSRYCWPENTLPKNCVVVLNGISIQDKPQFADTPSKPVVLGFVGRIHPYKGLHMLIDWIKSAHEAGLKFKLVIRGEAAIEEKGYLEDIHKRLDQSGLSALCEFQGRVTGYENVYKDLDIIVMPSVVAEPFGLVAIEAFERGLPCIAYPSGALPDIIDDGRTGFLCGDNKDFVARLIGLTTNPYLYATIQKNAFAEVISKYSLARLYTDLNNLYAT